MAIYRHVTSTYAPSSTSPAGPIPLNVKLPVCAAGDLLLAFATGRTLFPSGKGWQWSGQSPLATGVNYADAVFVAYRYAKSGESEAVENWTLDRDQSGLTLASFRDVRPNTPIDVNFTMGSFSAVEAPSLTPKDTAGTLVLFFGTTDPGGNEVASLSPDNAVILRHTTRHKLWRRDLPNSPLNATGLYTMTGFGNANNTRGGAILIYGNAAPNAPLLLSPANNQVLNQTIRNRFTWHYSDPEGHLQNAAQVRWRQIINGVPQAWVTSSNVLGNHYIDRDAAYFNVGSWEWQVRTQDNSTDPKWSAWSSSGYFSVAAPPAGAVITVPADGSTITTGTFDMVWSGAGTIFQIRKVADDGGTPDPTVVYFDSGELPVGQRKYTLTFDVNSRYEHLQVREQENGIWQTSWTSIRVLVAQALPTVPLLSVVPAKTVESTYDFTDALEVTVVNPTGTGGEPAVAYNRLFCTALTAGDKYRPLGVSILVEDLLLEHLYYDRRVASGVDYGYQVEAVGANGTRQISELVSEFRDLGPVDVVDEGDFADAEFDPADFD